MKKAPVAPSKPLSKKSQPSTKPFYRKPWFLLALTLAITLLVYAPSLQNGWTNWDDNGYVLENDLVRTLDLKTHFTTFQVMGNYHPVTTWSLAVDYTLHGTDAYGYHLTNLLFHLGSTALLFWFLSLLFSNALVAAFGALLFAIHPMHVESVAWISERKDVLYAFFYFGALVTWMLYLRNHKTGFYVATLLLFTMSLLSKGQAVTLPVVLVLIDWLNKRTFNAKALLEKVPFFLMALVFGVIAVLAQQESKAIQDIPDYTFLHRVLFAGYALFTYVWKFFVPVNLSAFYPYPIKGTMPAQYIVGLVVSIGLVGLAVTLFRRSRWMWFGFLLFGANIVLLLQLLPVGSAVVAERYTYVAYTGLIVALAYVLFMGLPIGQKIVKLPAAASGSIAAAMLMFCVVQTSARIKVWENSYFLWTDVLEQFDYAPNAHNNLGSYYQRNNEPDKAMHHFNVALRYQADFPEALINRSDIYRVQGKLDSAIADCSHAIRIDPGYTGAYMNRGIARSIAGDLDNAMADFNKVIELDPDNFKAYGNRGNLNDIRGNYENALADYSKALQLNPQYHEVYGNRSRTYVKLNRFAEALNDINSAIAANPERGDFYTRRADIYVAIQNYRAALQDVNTAAGLGQQVNPAFVEMLRSKMGQQ